MCVTEKKGDQGWADQACVNKCLKIAAALAAVSTRHPHLQYCFRGSAPLQHQHLLDRCLDWSVEGVSAWVGGQWSGSVGRAARGRSEGQQVGALADHPTHRPWCPRVIQLRKWVPTARPNHTGVTTAMSFHRWRWVPSFPVTAGSVFHVPD